MTKQQATKLAKKITDTLFINGCQERAERLVLMKRMPASQDERDLGGLCESAVIDRIVEVLTAATKGA